MRGKSGSDSLETVDSVAAEHRMVQVVLLRLAPDPAGQHCVRPNRQHAVPIGLDAAKELSYKDLILAPAPVSNQIVSLSLWKDYRRASSVSARYRFSLWKDYGSTLRSVRAFPAVPALYGRSLLGVDGCCPSTNDWVSSVFSSRRACSRGCARASFLHGPGCCERAP